MFKSSQACHDRHTYIMYSPKGPAMGQKPWPISLSVKGFLRCSRIRCSMAWRCWRSCLRVGRCFGLRVEITFWRVKTHQRNTKMLREGRWTAVVSFQLASFRIFSQQTISKMVLAKVDAREESFGGSNNVCFYLEYGYGHSSKSGRVDSSQPKRIILETFSILRMRCDLPLPP